MRQNGEKDRQRYPTCALSLKFQTSVNVQDCAHKMPKLHFLVQNALKIRVKMSSAVDPRRSYELASGSDSVCSVAYLVVFVCYA